MLKKFAVYLFALIFTAQPILATAGGVGDAFDGLLGGASSSVSGPGYFQSQTRGAFTGGSMQVRFGQKKVTFISIQAPSGSIGCSGISMHFGGFSFINGAQIAALLQQIGQAAVAFAIKLAIKTLCPQCEAVLADLTALAQKASQAGADSCKLGAKLADKAFSNLFPETHAKMEKGAKEGCSSTRTATGGADDFVHGITSSMCTGVAMLSNWYDEEFGKNSTNTADPGKGANVRGNLTWLTLEKFGFEKDERRLLISMIGSQINYQKKQGMIVCDYTTAFGAGGDTAEPDGSCQMPPLITDINLVIDLLMCGTTGTSSSYPIVASYCYKRGGPSNANWAENQMLYDCSADGDNPPVDPYKQCLRMSAVALGGGAQPGGLSFMDSTGFMHRTVHAMMEGVKAVENNTALPQPTIQLINSVPFPLYRLLNVAAVYPDAATDLIEANAEVISHLLATAMLQALIVQSPPKPSQTSVPASAVKELREILHQLSKETKLGPTYMNNALTLQEGLLQRIKDIDRSIQTQVMSQGLLANHSFAIGTLKGGTQ